MNLTFLLKGDVGAFNLLYNENDMYEAITRLDSTYKGNITAFDDYIGDITAKQFKKQKTADTKEDEELLNNNTNKEKEKEKEKNMEEKYKYLIEKNRNANKKNSSKVEDDNSLFMFDFSVVS